MPALPLLLLLASTQDLAIRPTPDGLPLTSGGLVWTHIPGNSFAGGMLSDRGGLVFGFHATSELLLLSSFDADPPALIWSVPDSHGISGFAVASDSDVFLWAAAREDAPVSTLSVLKKFRSRSSVPEWRYAFPEQSISQPRFDLSNDGQTIVSAFEDDASGTLLLRVHDPATGEPIRTIVNTEPVSAARLDVSPDGAAAGFSGLGGSRVYDLETGRLIFSSPGSLAFRQALSEEGRVLATAHFSPNGTHLLVHVRDRGSYHTVLDIATPPPLQLRTFAISDDGSTLVASWSIHSIHGGTSQAIVRAYDVPTGAMTMEHVDAAPSGTIVPGDLAVSADGSRFVVGLWGEASGAAPELALYSKESSQPLAVHPDTGP